MSLDRPAPEPTQPDELGGGGRGRGWVGLSEGLVAKLDALAATLGATRAAVGLAALALWRARLSHATELCVGLAAPPGPDGARAPPVPVPVSLEEGLSYSRLLVSLSAVNIDGSIFTAADPSPPLDQGARLGSPRGSSRRAGCETALGVLDDHGSCSAEADLVLALAPPERGRRGALIYDADRWDQATMTRWVGHLDTLLEGALAAPDAPVWTLPLLTEPQRRALVEGFNPAPTPRTPTCLHSLIEAAAAARPSAVAIVHQGSRLRFRELNLWAEQWSLRLIAEGVAQGAVVAVCMAPSPQRVALLLGVAKAGCVALPLDPSDPPERLSLLLRDSGAAMLAVDPDPESPIPDVSGVTRWQVSRRRWADGGEAFSELARGARRTVAPSDPVYLVYTSGSTGAPKAVRVEHHSLCNLLRWTQSELGFGPSDRCVATASAGFDIAAWELWAPLAAGATLHLLDDQTRRSLRRLSRCLVDHRITRLFLTTRLAEALLAAPLPEGLALRALYTGGQALHRPARALPFELVNLYGPTEATIISTFARVPTGAGQAPGAAVPIGRPIDNTTALVLDPHRQLCPVGVPGELYLGGAGLARDYLNLPELTAARFVQTPEGGRLYQTGDRARWRSDGQLEFLGRIDDQIKLRGVRIEPGEIEHALREIPGVRDCVVFVERDGGSDGRLVAVLAGESPFDAEILRAHLGRLLPMVYVPSRFVTLRRIPRDSRGKVDLAALRAELAAANPHPAASPPALDSHRSSPLQEAISALFREVLGLDRLSDSDSFFALGGDSLQLLRLLDQIEARFGVDFTHAMFLAAPTVAGVCAQLTDEDPAETGQVVVSIQDSNTGCPLFCVTAGYGDLVSFRQLSALLGPEQGFYALQPPLSAEARADVAALAACYADAVNRAQASGPYQIAGYSSGGLMALELARALAERGQEVRFLGLLDAPPRYDLLGRIAYDGARAVGGLKVARAFDLDARLARVMHFVQRDRGLRIHLSLLKGHTPAPYDGPVALFLPRRSLHRLGLKQRAWRRIATGPFTVELIDGDHESFIRPPHAAELAARLAAHLGGSGAVNQRR